MSLQPSGVSDSTLCAEQYVLRIDSLRTIVEHRSDQPVALFPLDGRPHLAHVRVETTRVSAYQALLEEVAS